MYDRALMYIKQMFGKEAYFREGQWEAIESILNNKKALVVQKTGWGKSIIYFIGTKLLRDKGKGPTILISPLLSLMRNQIESAAGLGISAETINSQNVEEWERIEESLKEDNCDILLISPEQLANKERFNRLISYIGKGIGFFVVDEAHCISDWGHDFRPDYRRIINIVNNLPPNVPVIATTATANKRVVDDISAQLGDIDVIRGPLIRESLRIQVIKIKDQSERMAWLLENIPKMPGVGIVYCLTVLDCNKVAKWLQINGINAKSYTGKMNNDERVELENEFMQNEIKCLVATVALGMGYDKSDIGFVIHYQRPGNVVSYYQQIGRAGRKLDNAYAILLNGVEDDDIQEYFIKTAFPTEEEMQDVVNAIENSEEGLKQNQILGKINIRSGRLEKCLKYLEAMEIIGKDDKNRYYRTLNEWNPDLSRSNQITKRRYQELEDIKNFVDYKGCYMQYIADKLDDKYARKCGKCAGCLGRDFFSPTVKTKNVLRAIEFLKGEYIVIESRKMFPPGIIAETGRSIPVEFQAEEGRALCAFGDAGWGKFIHDDKYVNNYLRDELVDASVELILKWLPDKIKDMQIAYIPSLKRPELVRSFARRVAEKLQIHCLDIIEKIKMTKQQKELENSTFQCKNAWDSFSVSKYCDGRDILLLDDMVDSRWTLTVCAYKLREKGTGSVYPFAIASTSGMRGDDL